MVTKEQLGWMALGVVALLAVKYPIVGLHYWNSVLHPKRTERPGVFYWPLMGLGR